MDAVFEWFNSEQGAAVIALAIPFACSIAAAVFKDSPGVMKYVNIVAANVGKAKNDPASQ